MKHNLSVTGLGLLTPETLVVEYHPYVNTGYILTIRLEKAKEDLAKQIATKLKELNPDMGIMGPCDEDGKRPYLEIRLLHRTLLFVVDALRTIGYKVTEEDPTFKGQTQP